MISVCMPTFNGEKYIKKQIESILSQMNDEDELIISDDSSTDSTIKIIQSFNDKRILLLQNNTFHSPIFNLENALKHVNGDYIFLTDQDDVWLPNKISTCLQYFRDYDLIISDAVVVDSDENVIHNSFFQINNSHKGFLHNLMKNGYVGCCICFKKCVLTKILPFPKNIPMHDSWIGLISTIYGKILFYNKALILYRRHDNNASFTANKSSYTIIEKIKHRLNLLQALFKRVLLSK